MNDCRRELLRIMARIEQLMAENEGITVGETVDGIMLRAAELLAEHRHVLADVELKLRIENRPG